MQRPSPLGLVVAAIVGGTAAASWTLSTWITFSQTAERHGSTELADAAAFDVPPVRSPPDLREDRSADDIDDRR